MDPTLDAPGVAKQEPLTSVQHPKLLFFDGECSFCTRWVARVIEADTFHRIRFSTLQGKTFQRVLMRRPDLARRNSVVLVQRRDDAREDFFTRSTAIRRLLDGLPGFRFFAFVLHVLPKPLSDLGYMFIAAFRDVLFGRWSACRPPVEENRSIFLD